MVALRSALYGVLLAALGPDIVAFADQAVACDDVPGGVALRFADGKTVTGDILIGAGGVGSVVRKTLHRFEPPPRPSGFCALRGVAYDAQRHLAGLSAVGYLGPGIEAATVRASENAVYWYLSMLTTGFDARFRAIASVEQVRARRTGKFMRWGPRIANVSTTHNRAIGAVRDAGVRIIPDALFALSARLGPRDPHRRLRLDASNEPSNS